MNVRLQLINRLVTGVSGRVGEMQDMGAAFMSSFRESIAVMKCCTVSATTRATACQERLRTIALKMDRVARHIRGCSEVGIVAGRPTSMSRYSAAGQSIYSA